MRLVDVGVVWSRVCYVSVCCISVAMDTVASTIAVTTDTVASTIAVTMDTVASTIAVTAAVTVVGVATGVGVTVVVFVPSLVAEKLGQSINNAVVRRDKIKENSPVVEQVRLLMQSINSQKAGPSYL